MSVVSTLFHAFASVFEFLLSLLPGDPFIEPLKEIFNMFSPWLGYINYFIPFVFFEKTAMAWLACVGTYYFYKFSKRLIMKE